MAVSYVTLYPPGGNSTTVQVVEGSQLHLIYAAMGFSATPSAPGPPVRPDPFPQYVHDDEIGDLLADAAVPATDPVVAALLNNTSSQTRAALDALDLGGDSITPEAVEANLPARLSDASLRAASVAAVEDAADVAPTGAWDFTVAPTVAGGAIALQASLPIFLTPSGGDDTAAMDAAVTLALSSKRNIWLGPGTFSRTTPWDLRHDGLIVCGSGMGFNGTVIRQATANTAVVRIGGQNQVITDLLLTYATQPSAANTGANAIEVTNAYNSEYRNLQMYGTARGIYLPQTAGNFGFFSCSLDNILIVGFSVSAISHQATTGTTGSRWNNVYIINEKSGSASRAVAAGAVIEFQNTDDMTFGQLNVEGVETGVDRVINFNGCRTILIEALHFERVKLTKYEVALLWCYADCNVQVGSMVVTNCEFSTGEAGNRYYLRAENDCNLTVGAVYSNQNSRQTGVTERLLYVSPTGTGTVKVGTYMATPLRTGSEVTGTELTRAQYIAGEKAYPGIPVAKEIAGEVFYRYEKGHHVLYGTAAPTTGTWTVGDKVWNTAPAAAGAPGWVCTTAGAPGTWKAMAALAA